MESHRQDELGDALCQRNRRRWQRSQRTLLYAESVERRPATGCSSSGAGSRTRKEQGERRNAAQKSHSREKDLEPELGSERKPGNQHIVKADLFDDGGGGCVSVVVV